MATEDDKIGRIERSRLRADVSGQRGDARRKFGSAPGPASGPPSRPDCLDLGARSGDVLGILRARVLAQTRGRLGVDATAEAHQPHFVEAGASQRIDVFVDRLLSAQNTVAAIRHGAWQQDRIDRALSESLSAGLTETWELLEELGQLDASAWATLDAVAAELSRKWSSQV